MDVLFVDLGDLISNTEDYISLGMIKLTQIVMKNGFHTSLLRRSNALSEDVYENTYIRLINSNAKVICFTSRCDYYPQLLFLIKRLKSACPHKIIILGGIQVTLTAKETLLYCPEIDYVIRDEGEVTLPHLLCAIRDKAKTDEVDGISYLLCGEPHENENQPAISPLDFILDVNWLRNLYPNLWNGIKSFPIEVGRGCTHRCTFCCSTTMWKQNYRLCSPQSVIQNMKSIYQLFGIHHFKFIHDNFLSSSAYKVFLEEFEPNGLTWDCSVRFDHLNEDTIELLSAKGCTNVFLGIETGSPKMQAVYNKHLDLSKINCFLKWLDQYNVHCTISFIIGHPQETLDDIRKTLELAIACRVHPACDIIQIHKLAPFKGSILYEQFKDQLVYDDSISDMVNSFGSIPNNEYIQALYSGHFSFSSCSAEQMEYANKAEYLSILINKYPHSMSYLIEHGLCVFDVISHYESSSTCNDLLVINIPIELNLKFRSLVIQDLLLIQDE